MINFNKIPEKLMPNFKGGDGITVANMFVDDKNKSMRLTLAPGASIGMHCHEDSCEVIYVLEGEGTVRDAVCCITKAHRKVGCREAAEEGGHQRGDRAFHTAFLSAMSEILR